jgi:hypothetical protein
MKFQKARVLRFMRSCGYLGLICSLRALLGCGPQQFSPLNSPSASCAQANVAEIWVGDGFLTSLCGCTGAGESSGVLYSGASVLNCHLLNSKTQVLFYFGKSQTPHQIVSTGGVGFTPTPMVKARSEMPMSYPIELRHSGVTYPFQDIYTGARGNIVVP